MKLVASAVAALLLAALPGRTDTTPLLPPTAGEFAYQTYTGPVAAGGTFIDPVFGTLVTRVTTDRAPDDLYGKNLWVNADEALIVHTNKIVDVVSGAVRFTVPRGQWTGDASFDPVNPLVYYYTTATGVHRVTLGSLITDVVDVAGAMGALGQSQNGRSADGALFLASVGGAVKVYDSTMQPFAGSVGGDPGGGWVALTPSGNHVIRYMGKTATSYKVDRATKTVGPGVIFWNGLCGDHAAPGTDTTGADYLLAGDCNNYDEIYRVNPDVNVANMTEDQQRAANKLLFTEHWQNDHHFTTVMRGPLADWGFFSTECVENCVDEIGATPAGWPAYRQEIVAVNVRTAEVRRLAHHSSRSIPGAYERQPRLSASPTGKFVTWASDFNKSASGVDLYNVQFGGSGGIVVPPEPVPVPAPLPVPPPLTPVPCTFHLEWKVPVTTSSATGTKTTATLVRVIDSGPLNGGTCPTSGVIK